MNAVTTVQDMTIRHLAFAGCYGTALGSELFIEAMDTATIYPCDHDSAHGKGMVRIADADGEITDLCLACALPCVEARLAFEDTTVHIEVRR